MSSHELRSLGVALRVQHGLVWQFPRLAWPMQPHPDMGQPWTQEQVRACEASEKCQQWKKARVAGLAVRVGCDPEEVC